MQYDEVISKVKSTLEAAGLARGLWEKIRWGKLNTAVGRPACYVWNNPTTINLYADLLTLPETAAIQAVLVEYGHTVLTQVPEKYRRVWDLKAGYPRQSQIDAFQGHLKAGNFKTYREIAESFPTAVDRMVAIHLSNALIANNLPLAESKNLDLRVWPATAEYSNRRQHHSLLPLIHAYCPREMLCYGTAFAEVAVHRGGHIPEPSLREAIVDMVELVAAGI